MPNRSGSRPIAVGLALAALGLAAGISLAPAFDAIRRVLVETPDALPWFGTRLFAFLAYLALAGSVLYGLLLSSHLLERVVGRPVSFTLHRDLVAAALALALAHAGLLLVDAKVPFSALDLAIPFAAPYRPFWVGLGQVALGLTAAVFIAFGLRRQVGPRPWRALHGLAFAAFVASTAHGIAAGSDTASPWAWWLYAGSGVATAFLMTYRIAIALARPTRPLDPPGLTNPSTR